MVGKGKAVAMTTENHAPGYCSMDMREPMEANWEGNALTTIPDYVETH